MSAPHCENCGDDIPLHEAVMCEQCERALCCQCLVEHSCSVAAVHELQQRSPHFQIGYSTKGKT
jgi:hypothetical protein